MPYTRIRKWVIASVSLAAVILVGDLLYARLYEKANRDVVREEREISEPTDQAPVPSLTGPGVATQESDVQAPEASNTALPDQNTAAVNSGAQAGAALRESLVSEKIDLACKALGIELERDARTEKRPPYGE